MRITNQAFIAPPMKNTRGVKPEEKLQKDKVNGKSEMSQAKKMDAFKKDFYNELSKITTHQTVSNMSVNVSEKAFQAMKDDPAYKEKVLSLIKRDCQGSYGSRNCSLSITIGTSTNQYRADAWPVGYDSAFGIRSQNSFYKSSKKKTKEDDELRVQYSEQRWQAMKFQQTLDTKRNIEREEFSTADLEAAREWTIDSELKTAIPDEDFIAQLKAIREQKPQLEVNWDRMVDPDGKIAARTYVESLVKQYQKVQNNITEYYSKAHQDNLSRGSQTDALNYISLKYTKFGLEVGSPYYRADMSEAERNMALQQERALILGGSITMKDPYALASTGGILNVEDADKIAHQAVRDKLDELREQWERNHPDKFEK